MARTQRRQHRERTTTSKLRNKRMNDDTFALRSAVMQHIREAKALCESNGIAWRRVELRITHNGEGDKRDIAGVGRMGDAVIWIPERTLEKSKLCLRHVVFHELCHALFATQHDLDCRLMHTHVQKTTRRQQDSAFIKHAKAA